MQLGIISKYVNRGIQFQDSIDQKIAIKSYNIFFAVMIVVFALYEIVYIAIGNHILTIHVGISIIAALVINFVFRIERYFLLLRTLNYALSLYAITITVAMVGTSKGIEVCYFAVLATLPIVFEPKEIKWIRIGNASTLACYLFLWIFNPRWDSSAQTMSIHPGSEDPYRAFSFLVSISVVAYCMLLVKRQQIYVQSELDEQRGRTAESSRLAALGEMAGGIAHEINNPLAIISATTEQVLIRKKNDTLNPDFLQKSLERSLKMTNRISAIISGMKKLARGESEEQNQAELVGRLFEEAYLLCEEKMRTYGIKFELELPENPIWISCRPEQLLQVLINLLHNAVDAISHLPDQWIILSCIGRDENVEISVTDSGTSIPPEVAHKMFNPFFTTKSIGKGTGLGLSISRGIIAKFGGNLSLDTSSKHTRFVVTLPCIQQEAMSG